MKTDCAQLKTCTGCSETKIHEYKKELGIQGTAVFYGMCEANKELVI